MSFEMKERSKPLISVIVPIYNTEMYLDRCVKSLLNQTYDRFEILLVDDGSPDNCPGICDAYAEKYKNITVLHKPNGGLGEARNYGVGHAKGNWIVVVDSDDYVEPRYLSDLWELKETFHADMAMAWSIQVDENGYLLGKKFHFDAFAVSGSDAIYEIYTGNHVGWSACNKLYPKDVLLRFPFPDGYYEDMACMYRIADAVGTIAIGDFNQNYKYVQHTGGSILNSPLSERHMRAFEICKAFGSYMDEKYPELELLKPLIYIHSVVQMLHRQHMTWGDYKRIFYMHRNLIRKSCRQIMTARKIPKKTKIFTLLLSSYPWIYKLCHKVSKILRRINITCQPNYY